MNVLLNPSSRFSLRMQTFRGQHEDTAENRSFIKINGDSIAGSEDFCSALAKMSVQGITDWRINLLALPICYGEHSKSNRKEI